MNYDKTPITVVTGNRKKAEEIATITGWPIENVALDILEIQSLEVEMVASEKAKEAFRRLNKPVLVDDTGMRIEALGGLPGALVSWFLDSVGTEGIIKMMRGEPNRRASVSTCVAYCDAERVRVFTGTVHGAISDQPRGENGFGYDPIFIPDGESKTYAEMTSEQKNTGSMRSIALTKVRDFLSDL